MSFKFDNLLEKAKDLAQTGVAKAKELTDTAVDKGKELSEIGKLKVQNATEQEAIKKAYLEIGKLYYAERGAAPEAAYAALCEQISGSQAKIDYNNERIADIRAAGNLADEDIPEAEYTEEAPAEEAPAEETPAGEAPMEAAHTEDCGEDKAE